MGSLRLFPRLVFQHLSAMVNSYRAVFNAEPWKEDWTERAAGAHITKLIGVWGADPVLIETSAGVTCFALGTQLNLRNPILDGLKQFGASDGDYYISELVVPAAQSHQAEAKMLITELCTIAAESSSVRVWARTHPDAIEDHALFKQHGFQSAGTYSHHGHEWAVFILRLSQ